MLKENEIYLGDCLELMRSIPDKSIDCVITDPPYGINYNYINYEDTQENLIFLINNFMPEFIRIAKNILIFPGVNNIWNYPKADWVISYSWDTTATYGKLGYNQWQPILFYGKDISGFGSINGQIKSDCIKFSGGSTIGFLSDCPKGDHPCPKPFGVMKKVIQRFTNENDLILDPFLGSGTTAIACYDLKRRYIGIEKEQKYFEIAKKRIDDFKAQGRLF